MADLTALGIGMKAVGWVASPIISELFKRSSSYLSFDASEKLRQLGPKILLLERAMELFQSPDRPHHLEPLFEDLKSAFYEAEDILDDVEYHRLESQIQDDKSKSGSGSAPPRKRDWVKKKVRSVLPSSPLKNKETGISKKLLKESLEKIEDIINNTCKFLEQLNLSSASNCNGSQAVEANSRNTVITATAPLKVIGRDKDRDKIIEMLREKESGCRPNTNSGQCYSVIGIHGIGGSGKSTLAQYVYAREKKDMEEKKDGHFELVMWVHVSWSFSLSTIFSEMFEEATGKSCSEFKSLNTLQGNLMKELQGKRIFLILDDVWYNKHVGQHELQQILSPLVVVEQGSKILVTSRTTDAILAMRGVKCIPISELDDNDFLNLFMHYALEDTIIDDHVRRRLEVIGADIAKKLKGSPLAARTVGGRLRIRPTVEFWTKVKNQKLFDGTMGALWWSYQHLDVQARRCFAYCSIFPRRLHLYRHELVKLWVAEGFIRSTNEGEELEDVGREYFDELVSTSFLQPGGKVSENYYLVHDLLHDLAETVAGGDCFRIENVWRWREGSREEGWPRDIPRGVRHLFVQNFDGELITDKILALENLNLRTLIIYTGGWVTPVEEKVIENIFKRLRKLRVLAVAFGRRMTPEMLSIPECISQLKHLRYLAFRTCSSCRVILPSTLTKLYHIQLLDFGHCKELEFSSADLINLRHVSSYSGPIFSDIGRLTLLETIPSFRVRKEKGCEVKLLRDLNKLRGCLYFGGLGNVESKEEALEANLAAKEQLTELRLNWDWQNDARCSPEVEAEVLEGLCPPVGLETLTISYYKGTRYPNWMVGKQDAGPKDLQELSFHRCSQLGPAPRVEAFIHLRVLMVWCCSWDTLPGNMEHLTSLKGLMIYRCLNIRSLPTLPPSLEEFTLADCNDEFMKSCQTDGHPNWQKIEHISKKKWTW